MKRSSILALCWVATLSTFALSGTPSLAQKTAIDGRQAEYARERACANDWKADKAANKVPTGMTWPKYWRDCNKRKKAMGM